jgi:RNA polymerase sigma-70 factor (ECF subfamily)
MSVNDEAKLVENIALGDHAAYKEIFLKYFPKVKYFIAHFVKSETIAEDLAQEIFIKLWENRFKLTSVQSFNSYIYRMAKNAMLNYIEHKDVEKKYMEQQYKDESWQSIENELYARELELLVQLTVNQMPSQRKRIYKMSRDEGLKNEEIAGQLSISKKTVENHLNIALKEIRKTISLLALFFV